MNVTEALRAAIALMYDKVSREHLRPADLLRQGSSFLAMGASGRADVSARYKDELTALYGDKISATIATDADR